MMGYAVILAFLVFSEVLGILVGIILSSLKYFGVLSISWFWAVFPFWGTVIVTVIGYVILATICTVFGKVFGERE